MKNLATFIPIQGPIWWPHGLLQGEIGTLLNILDDWSFFVDGHETNVSVDELPQTLREFGHGMRGRWQLILGHTDCEVPEPTFVDGTFSLCDADRRFNFAARNNVILLEEWGGTEEVCYGITGGTQAISCIPDSVLRYACRPLRPARHLVGSSFAIASGLENAGQRWLRSVSSSLYLAKGAQVLIETFWWKSLLAKPLERPPFGDPLMEFELNDASYSVLLVDNFHDIEELWKLVSWSEYPLWILPLNACVKEIEDYKSDLLDTDCFLASRILDSFEWAISPTVSSDFSLVIYDTETSRKQNALECLQEDAEDQLCVW